jgi:hypothetical protein
LTVELQIEVDDQASPLLEAALAKIQDQINAGLDEAGNEIVIYAQQICPYRTGRLRASITYMVADAVLTVMATAPYAKYVEFGCFLNQSFKVLTKRGSCKYRYLRVGDEVLTHKMRWRRITEKFSQSFSHKLPHFKIITEGGKQIIVTPNHPVLTPSGWRVASDLRIGDQLCVVKNDLPRFHWKNFMDHNPLKGTGEKVERTCARCGAIFSVPKWRLRFRPASHKWYCSQACSYASRANNQGSKGKHWHLTAEQIEKHRGQRNAMFNKQRSHYYTEIGYREDLGHKTKSTWEANYCRILRLLGLNYEYEPESFHMPDGTTYTPDIKVNGKYVEIKGYMTATAIRKMELFRQAHPDKRLVIVDEALYSRLALAYRQKIRQWEDGGVSITGRDLKMLTEKVTAITSSFTHPRNIIYNISVEEDESYIGNGIVMHNTRRMRAEPYIRPAIDAYMNAIVSSITEQVLAAFG